VSTDSERGSEPTDEEYAAWDVKVARQRAERLALYEGLERRLGIPVGFIESLVSEPDDWAYIVKLAVLCEAAVTHALVGNLKDTANEREWYDHFSGLASGRRLELAFRLGLLSRVDRDALDAIAQIRNSFAHEVRNLGGSLSVFFQACSADKKVELANKLLLGMKHTKHQDWGFYVANTRMFVHVGMLGPIKSLAAIGMDQGYREELEERWKGSFDWPNQPTPS
jgi:hypothetical protein